MRMISIIGFFAVTFCIVLLSIPVHASVKGTVTDTNGDPVAGATVTFIQEDYPENSIREVTDSEGGYSINLTVGVDDGASTMPQSFILGQNYPNPFNPTTTIPFRLDKSGDVRLDVFNITGQHIRTLTDGYFDAGFHNVVWDAGDDIGNHVSAGIYFYRLRTEGAAQANKMLLLDGGGSSVGASYIAKPSNIGGMQSAAKIAVWAAFTVTITHDSIIPYEELGVEVSDGGVLDFEVELKGDTTVIEGITFVTIPGGSFRMGDLSGDGDGNWERPVHSLTISSFEMGVYEVTQEQYQSVKGSSPANNLGAGDDYPVYFVSWYDAVKFCNALSVDAGLTPCYDESSWSCDFSADGFRLPTEAEWEYACRAGTETKYYTGNANSDLATAGWYRDNSRTKTHPVGQKTANAFGLYDMHGNVYEWCSDWYGESYYSSSPSSDSTGPTSGSYRVYRGGSWASEARNCRSADRRWSLPTGANASQLGFRVVRRP